MNYEKILLAIFAGFFVSGSLALVAQIYRLTVIDARARGLKHPRFWGLINISSNNGAGMIFYLIFRRKYPIVHKLGEADLLRMGKLKRASGASIIFMAIGAVGVIWILFMFKGI